QRAPRWPSATSFKPDPDFVPPRGGSAVASILERARSKSGSRVALVGPAGVGKSQLAMEYCCQADEVFRLPLVFRVGTETRERFLGDLRSIADLLDIRDYGTTELEVTQRVAQWLLDPSNGPWSLVLDGVTDADVLSCGNAESAKPGTDSGIQQRVLWDLVSDVSHGSILVTTGDKYTAPAPGIKSSDIVPVSAMSGTQAVNLLQKRLGNHDQQSGQDHMALQLTPAASLLSFMAFFDRDHIPTSLIESRKGRADESAVAGADQGNESNLQTDEPSQRGDGGGNRSTDASERGVQVLLDTGFIAKGGPGVFSMPQVVQLAVRYWLKKNRRFEHFESRFIRWMHWNFPPGHFENWVTCRRLYPHVQKMTRHRPTDPVSLEEQAEVLCHASLYLLETGYHDEAMELANLSLDALKVQKPEHRLVLASKHYLGRAQRNLGHYQAADDTFSDLLRTCTSKSSLDQNHPEILVIECELARVYLDQKDFKEAERRYSEVLSKSTETLGGDHPFTLNCMAERVMIHIHRDNVVEAQKLGAKVLNLRRSRLGEEHPHTLRSELTMADTYYRQKKWKKARELQLHVKEASELGRDYHLIGDSMKDLAYTEYAMNSQTRAVKLAKDCITFYSNTFGPEHKDTHEAQEVLAEILSEHEATQQAQEALAESLFERRESGHKGAQTKRAKRRKC
ncbi:uncharacterized protein B0I36DRAFT_400926, partial [Microdochium trichocladiopsis]